MSSPINNLAYLQLYGSVNQLLYGLVRAHPKALLTKFLHKLDIQERIKCTKSKNQLGLTVLTWVYCDFEYPYIRYSILFSSYCMPHLSCHTLWRSLELKMKSYFIKAICQSIPKMYIRLKIVIAILHLLKLDTREVTTAHGSVIVGFSFDGFCLALDQANCKRSELKNPAI